MHSSSGSRYSSAALAIFWGLLYVAFGEPLGGAIPLAYTLLSLASIVFLTLTRRYDAFRFTQLTLMLVLPFALMIALGGFIPSSVVVTWAFFAPLGALAFASPREALRWFAAYLVLLVAVGTIGGAARTANNLPPTLISAMFIVNITAVSVLVFSALYVFVRERDRALAAVQRLFGQYLSPQIARTLLSDPSRAALGGENREVTALFADLQGFTPFVESRPPHHTILVLNRYFRAVVPVIFANGGTIIQFAGDAIVAVWNAPIEQPRHALAAARTALAMQRTIETIVQEDPSLPRFRVGIATGAALVGNVGSEEFRTTWRMETRSTSRRGYRRARGRQGRDLRADVRAHPRCRDRPAAGTVQRERQVRRGGGTRPRAHRRPSDVTTRGSRRLRPSSQGTAVPPALNGKEMPQSTHVIGLLARVFRDALLPLAVASLLVLFLADPARLDTSELAAQLTPYEYASDLSRA